MTEQEINKTIAEFMGAEIIKSEFHQNLLFADGKALGKPPHNYTKSLDALVPVVERLGAKSIDIGHLSQPQMNGNSHYCYLRGLNGKGKSYSVSYEMALATAIYKVLSDE